MRKPSFVSKLIYALRERLGWCPEQPTLKAEVKEVFMRTEGSLFFEKSFSWFILLRPLSWWLIAFQVGVVIWLVPSWFSNLGAIFVFAIFVFLGIVNVVPFILKREILLTPKELRLRLGFSEDVIETKDIKSVEYVGGKRPLLGFIGKFSWEFFWNWGGWNLPPFLGVAWTKTQEEETKWYFFGAERSYLKINRQEGTAICIGVDDPKLFANRLTKIMPSVASNLIEEIEKEAKNMKAKYQQTSIGELYDRLLRKYSIVEQRYSIVEMVLESRINKLVKQGLTREQAIREIAGNEEVLEL